MIDNLQILPTCAYLASIAFWFSLRNRIIQIQHPRNIVYIFGASLGLLFVLVHVFGGESLTFQSLIFATVSFIVMSLAHLIVCDIDSFRRK
jgi:hypothetical protein